MTAVLGRERELALAEAFLELDAEQSHVLLLEGEAGVGKTTLWLAGVQRARELGLQVLEARPAASEHELSFAGLSDLLAPVHDEIGGLPGPQRRALRLALLLEESDGKPPEPRAVGAAVLGLFRLVAATDAKLLIAIDDVQWLDAATAAAVAYAARRLRDEPIGLLLARRVGLESALVDELSRSARADHYVGLELGPLDPTALYQVVHTHLDVSLPRPRLAEVHHASGGNPFYALEIVRTLTRYGVTVDTGRPFPLPNSLHTLVHARLLALPPESREFLVAAAAHAHPTISITEKASGVERGVGLAPALDAHIIETEGNRLRFTHPLLAAGALEAAEPERRAKIHARLAELLEDPEARAWQLAASVDEPDESVAVVLEDAARHARKRGAPRPAALLLDCAREFTPAEMRDDALRRAVDAAYLHYESGDSPRAQAQLREVIAQLPSGSARARALARLARVRAYVALADASELFLQAVAEAEDDTQVLAVAHEGVATCLFRLYQRLPEAIDHAERAAAFAVQADRPALAAEALATRWTIELLLGRAFEETRRRERSLQARTEHLRVLAQPRFADAAAQLWLTETLEEARDDFLELLDRASDLGDESSRPLILAHLAEVECELGQLDAALAHAVEGQDSAAQAGQQSVFAHSAAEASLVAAQQGDAERTRALAMLALELVPDTAGRQTEFIATRALGHLALALGAADTAAASLEPLVQFAREQLIAEPGLVRFAVDLVEAMTALGRREDATDVLDWYEGNARRLGRTSALANCARCRGMLAAQANDIDVALAAYEEALEWHAHVALPLDRARTLLALGVTQRRAKRRREARATLEEALATFDRIGASLWAGRALAELKRISGRAAVPGALTPAEERVAAIVAEGKTNREVAAALFISDRTVEGHLSRIYGKLGVRSRAELTAMLAKHHRLP